MMHSILVIDDDPKLATLLGSDYIVKGRSDRERIAAATRAFVEATGRFS